VCLPRPRCRAFLVLAPLEAHHGDVVEQLTHREDAGAQQQPQEAAHLPEQARQRERLLLADRLETQVLVEHVHLQEVLPGYNRHVRVEDSSNDITPKLGSPEHNTHVKFP
jgi:hypothetical protein